MARPNLDREDLLTEATALVERIELALPGYAEPVLAGFRASRCASLFFGADPVYQFNSQSQLRRAYAGGLLYKAQRGRLVSIARTRQAGRLELIERPVDEDAHVRFLATMTVHLNALRGALGAGQGEILRQVPLGGDVLAQLRAWLTALGERVEVAASPHAR
jgi:hypothetical protein